MITWYLRYRLQLISSTADGFEERVLTILLGLPRAPLRASLRTGRLRSRSSSTRAQHRRRVTGSTCSIPDGGPCPYGLLACAPRFGASIALRRKEINCNLTIGYINYLPAGHRIRRGPIVKTDRLMHRSMEIRADRGLLHQNGNYPGRNAPR